MINDKVYIGQTTYDVKHRWKTHLGGYKYKHGQLPKLHNAFDKYGIDNFYIIPMIKCKSVESLNDLEEYLITLLNTQHNGYNTFSGGSSRRHTIETLEKMSKAHKGKNVGKDNPFYGKKHSIETLAKLSKSHKGYKHSEESKNRMSESRRGDKSFWFGKHLSQESKNKLRESHLNKYDGDKNPFYGKTHTESTKKIISSANRGKVLSDNHKKILSVCNAGENNSSSILTELQVKLIKKLLKMGVKGKQIAGRFNIGTSTVYRIRDGLNWYNVYPTGPVNIIKKDLTRKESLLLLNKLYPEIVSVRKEDSITRRVVNGKEVK